MSGGSVSANQPTPAEPEFAQVSTIWAWMNNESVSPDRLCDELQYWLTHFRSAASVAGARATSPLGAPAVSTPTPPDRPLREQIAAAIAQLDSLLSRWFNVGITLVGGHGDERSVTRAEVVNAVLSLAGLQGAITRPPEPLIDALQDALMFLTADIGDEGSDDVVTRALAALADYRFAELRAGRAVK